MIDISTYIEQAMDYFMSQELTTMDKEFMYQKENLNSIDYNYNLNNIYIHLVDLYEKSRILEDLIAYAKKFIKDNIYNTTDECIRLLKEIEENIDNTKEYNYTTEIISFSSSTGDYTDRDNKILPNAAVCDSLLTLSNQKEKEIVINNISLKNNLIPYRNTLKNLLENKSYRSFYLLDNPVKDGLKENIFIELKEPQEINQLSIISSNCNIANIEFYLENGTIETVKNHNIIHSSKKVKDILITLDCDNYKQMTYYVDNLKMKYNYWDTIKESLYQQLTGESGKTQAELDEESGLKAFREQYDAYVKAINSWLEERDKVAKINTSNGYADSVPTIDFIVAPEKIYFHDTQEDVSVNDSVDNLYRSGTKNILSSETSREDICINQTKFYPSAENIKYQLGYMDTINSSIIDKNNNKISLFRSDL